MSTQARKRQVDATQYGRSMVEMLGVLAIIGVLSVGGIAGYSKAMMKYKMNKFTASINELFQTSMIYVRQFDNNSNKGKKIFLPELLYKMNEIPDGMKYKDRKTFEDIFGGELHYSFSGASQYNASIEYVYGGIKKDNLKFEICSQLFNIAKENSSQTHYIYIKGRRLSGDLSCTEGTKCLKNMTISDIENECKEPQNSSFVLQWYLLF